MKIQNAALIGMGAIGTVYGYALNKKYGSHFAVVAGGERAEKIRKNGVSLNAERFYPRVIAPQDADFSADLVILCVKNYSLDQAIEDIRRCVGPHTLILPLLNGITARERLQKAFPDNPVFYGLCVYVDAVRTEAGVNNDSNGVIQFGNADNTQPSSEVEAVKDYLADAGLSVESCPDMLRAVWRKWMLNVGCNQVSAVTGAPYGKMTLEPNTLLLHEAMLEVIALAKARGIPLTGKDALDYESKLRTFSPNGKTSMLQDVEAKRKTEVEFFSGTVIRLGEELHVPTPVNHVLYFLLKSKEEMY
jgi:2-dehydropantoate 2-reductase